METGIERREFLRTAAAIGAALYIAPEVSGQNSKPDDINVALLGVGEQGQTLLKKSCIKMKGLRFKAVCDIWKSYNLHRTSGTLRAYKHEHNTYEDYKEMLDKEKDLDAVIIATPDFWHSEHTVACLKAGLHVYCEKEMSNTLEGARKMVEVAKASGKMLQIGHQRRSSPSYLYCYEKLIKEAKLLNRITTVNGQWNRSRRACEEHGWGGDKYKIDQKTLDKYGFESMTQFRNWRWYKGLGGGPIVDLGSHQIDVYSWFLGANPKSVIASGGTDYWKGRQWYDNIMAIYEYDTKNGPVRAFYQTLTTNSSHGYYESFMGDEGTLMVSEGQGRTVIYRESWVPAKKWDKWVKKGYIKATVKPPKPLAAMQSPEPPKYEVLTKSSDILHYAHLENFFDAVRGKAKLNCPAEVGYETAVAVLKVNEAVAAERKLEFKPGDFKV
jgi:predicted dehydrogenase